MSIVNVEQVNNIMGQQTRDTTEEDVVKRAKFINETEGIRPPVNDPRRDAEIKKELTPEEVRLQAEATEKWATQYLKSPIHTNNEIRNT